MAVLYATPRRLSRPSHSLEPEIDRFDIPTADGFRLAAAGARDGAQLVLLHPGVLDLRCWDEIVGSLGTRWPAVAYDRPGFGGTPPADREYAHVAHLLDVVDAVASPTPVLIGCSQGGRVSIDFALTHPDRVGALVLIAPAISGGDEPDWLEELGRELFDAFEEAEAADDLDRMNELEARVWLDGPRAPAGRVAGHARQRFLEMNGVALANEGGVPAAAPTDATGRLAELRVPVLVVQGALDVGATIARSRALAATAPDAQLAELEGTAHVPMLDAPERLIAAITPFLERVLGA